jgi:hypothetical protein
MPTGIYSSCCPLPLIPSPSPLYYGELAYALLPHDSFRRRSSTVTAAPLLFSLTTTPPTSSPSRPWPSPSSRSASPPRLPCRHGPLLFSLPAAALFFLMAGFHPRLPCRRGSSSSSRLWPSPLLPRRDSPLLFFLLVEAPPLLPCSCSFFASLISLGGCSLGRRQRVALEQNAVRRAVGRANANLIKRNRCS